MKISTQALSEYPLEQVAGIVTVEATDRMLASGETSQFVGGLVLKNFMDLAQTIQDEDIHVPESTRVTLSGLQKRVEECDASYNEDYRELVAEASLVFASTLADMNKGSLARLSNNILYYSENGVRALNAANTLLEDSEPYFSPR